MISTIKLHQPPPTPNPASRGASMTPSLPTRRLEHLQYLDLTDCTSLEDTGLKMVVETCPQLFYLFLRRCSAITGEDKIINNAVHSVLFSSFLSTTFGKITH
jgi:hypothetical protein